MTGVFGKIVQIYDEYVIQKSDRRSDDLFLVSSPVPVAVICTLYLLFILKWGPAFMNNRQPYKIERLLTAYNIVQIFANAYLVLMMTIFIIPYYSPACEPADYSDNPRALLALHVCHIFFLLKLSDLLDTVFFILRKNYRQVTFLHVYHHFGTFVMSWIAVRFVGGGHTIYVFYLNSIVHIFMYLYYLMSAWNAEYKKKALSFKKHITQLQLLQLGVALSLLISTLLREECTYPKIIVLLYIPQDLVVIYHFIVFYKTNYWKDKSL